MKSKSIIRIALSLAVVFSVSFGCASKTVKWPGDDIRFAEEFNRTNSNPYVEAYTHYLKNRWLPRHIELGYRSDGVVIWRYVK